MISLVAPPAKDFDIYIDTRDTLWAQREPHDTPESLYEAGYLPYSGARDTRDIWYRGRSARIVLPQFELTSENRRIARKFDGVFRKERIPFDSFVPTEEFFNFCLTYFAQKHGSNAMPRERLETILASGLIKNTMIYHSGSKSVAYVLEVESGTMGHYWFSFYDLAYAKQSLGMWLMLDALRDAKARGLTHYYLGTLYGQNALYKTNFSPLEWFSGEIWSTDIEALKRAA